MASVRDSVNTVTSIIQTATEFGMTLILALVIIDVLFPGSTTVVSNIGAIVGQFSTEGLSGLIALLLFLILFKNK
jgi:hypothetical protein